MTDWKPDPRTVQACIDALPKPEGIDIQYFGSWVAKDCRKALEALLPKRDRAAELVEAYKRRCGDFDNQHDIEMLSDFARDLIETGVIPDDK